VRAGPLLRQARSSARLTQQQLAAKTGIQQSALSRIERDNVSPTLETVDLILRACGKELQLVDRPGMNVDRNKIRARLGMTPGERARSAQNALDLTRRRQPSTTARGPVFEPFSALHLLEAHEVRFVLTGGFAEALRGSPMAIRGLDFCYPPDSTSLDHLAGALEALGASLRGSPAGAPFVLEPPVLGAGNHFALQTHAGPVDCHKIPAGTEGFDDLAMRASDVDLDGKAVQVASFDDLIRMRLALGSYQDLVALEWLSALRDELEFSPM
jgi:transcriptional regulator with XRE-family HTH domain